MLFALIIVWTGSHPYTNVVERITSEKECWITAKKLTETMQPLIAWCVPQAPEPVPTCFVPERLDVEKGKK